jgi:hypothetical protein
MFNVKRFLKSIAIKALISGAIIPYGKGYTPSLIEISSMSSIQ